MPRPCSRPSILALPPILALPRRLAGGLALGVLLVLAGCAPQPPSSGFVGIAPPFGGPARATPVAPPRAGLLLPRSGPQAPLGQAMFNAASMALFDEAPTGVEFTLQDTGGTPAGAAAAARAAIAEGARILVGPLTSAEVAAVAEPARAAGIPVLAFTNDAQRAGGGVWVLGITPQQQVRRVVAAAAQQGAQRFALGAPNTEFGRALASALRAATAELGLPQPSVTLHPGGSDPAMAASGARATAGPVQAVLIGETGERARRFAAAWVAESQGGPTMLLGTALWLNDTALRSEPALQGAWFAGPDGPARARFEARYRDAFTDTPPRVAATAYDAAAIATRALRGGTTPGQVTAGGFGGADGPVRLMPDGQTLRGLGLYALGESGGEPVQIEPPPPPGVPGT